VTDWYRLEAENVLSTLDTGPGQGLTNAEAQRRLIKYGPNELIERGLKSPWRILWEQLTAIMVIILIVATVISAFLGDYKTPSPS